MKARISKLGQAFLRNGKAARALSNAILDNPGAIAIGEPVQFRVAYVNRQQKTVDFTAIVRKVSMNRP
ncbi:hypothetical protein [Chitinophaga sancti]|uniref:Uncharacterized protein n=1 Tax=Chitinophaga sancti TaxID=1004 RepID=A0A1K1S6B4_9BACT|nr:hypothetical protein [Chitinophaga sancti]WQD62211.1 hypothetical protein U0033_30435 [Chitinophaga sancti]WQG92220.1 hypothetical protein SR876_11950 [Chitinophaga sancti]SFW79889.1 hypothetical protein SAMN05661012_04858 [Chitinophaga sancti]